MLQMMAFSPLVRSAGAVSVLLLALVASVQRSTSAEWPTATSAEAGFTSSLAAELDAALATDDFDGVHAVVLVRGGQLVYERYLTGNDEKLGRIKEGVVFGPDSLHDIRSITKSVVGLLYGIALGAQQVPAPEAPLLGAFPEYPDLAESPARQPITVAHALSMTMGLQWDEMTIPYSDPANSEIAMYRAADSLRFALDLPVVSKPGDAWVYSGGATELIAAIVARGTGRNLDDYAREMLFEPLGIETFEWVTDYYGRPHAAAGLRLRPRDTAKLGQLVLQTGRWNGTQLVSADWIGLSTRPHAEAMDGCRYGYQWWLCKTERGLDLVEGAGWGGQELLIVPEHDVVLVVNAGLYGNTEAWLKAYALLEDIILPAIEAP
jgi:CubicO group peptidase (beta-lactamase class C family)